MSGIVQRTALWLARLDPTSAELVLALAALACGAALLIPVDLSVRSPAFRYLVELFPQVVWATIWIALGAAQLAGATTGLGRQQADVAVACLWVFWVAVQILTLGATLGPFVYGSLAVGCLAVSHLQRQHGNA